jgi:ATP-dependent Clp protease protease subunit
MARLKRRANAARESPLTRASAATVHRRAGSRVIAKKDHRYALPNTRFMIHQPLGGAGGPASDIEIEATQIIQMRERLNRIFARATGQDSERVVRDTERNFWMTAPEAVKYGLVGHVVETLTEVPPA